MTFDQLAEAGPRASHESKGFSKVRLGRPGSVGQFGWSGAASTNLTIVRQEQLIAILLMQQVPQGLPQELPKISARFYNPGYQSLVK